MAMNKQRKSSNLINILSYDDAGNIVLKDYSQTIRYNWNGTIHAFTGPLSISSVAAAVTDTDRFLVSDGGVLKYRTGAEVLSDIGAIGGSGATGQVAYWNGTSSQTGSNNLFWDAANARLGIGTNTPSTTLDIRGKTRIQSSGNAELDIIDGSNSLRLAMGSTQGFVGTLSSHPFGFFTGALKRGEFSTNGNFILQNGGTFTDGGQRLQVQGDAFIKGSGATSATTALTVQNSAGNNMFRIANNGAISLGNSSLRASIFTFTTNQGVIDFSGTNLSFYNSTSNLSATSGAFAFGGDSFFQTTGNQLFFSINMTFVPTSGTATFASLNLSPGINQTGGANGITRGLYVNPTLTAAADWRSIEWSNNSGWGLYGAGTANNYLGGRLGINATSVNSAWMLGVTGNIQLSGFLSFGSVASAASNAYIDVGASEVSIYAGAGRKMSFWTDGSVKATITNAGRLLLGTTTESTFLLDVNGTARVSGASTFGGTLNINTAVWLQFNGANVLLGEGTNTFLQANGGGSIIFRNNTPSELMRLTAGGNLLVGTTTDAGQKFQVSGSGLFTGSGNTLIKVESTASFPLYQLTKGGGLSWNIENGRTSNTFGIYQSGGTGGGTTYLAIAEGGNVLINTVSDSGFRLDVSGTARVQGAATFSSSVTATTFNGTTNNVFSVDGSERLRITSGGNLLVGTTADQGYRVQITSASADSQLNVWGATAPSIRLDNAASGATQRFVIGLATATNNFIQGANAGDICMTPGTSSALVFGMWQTSSSSEVMRISTSSNVLIGKNTDSGQKLQVVGKVNLTSLPTSATGLMAGDVWNNGGVLNIV